MLKHRLVNISKRYSKRLHEFFVAIILPGSLAYVQLINSKIWKQFKALESMAEQVRPEGHSTHATSSAPNKTEKYATKSRGSGSPFKCIGLGMAQQIKSEKDEELMAARTRIEELESLALCRQKEVGLYCFMWWTSDSRTISISIWDKLLALFYHNFILFHFLGAMQIFNLNSKLASADSMTHDVLRDLLGVKLDMTTYAVHHIIPNCSANQ